MEKTETTKSPIPGENISEKTEEEKWSYEERVESKDDFLRRCREAVLELKDL